jgi:hypothetical protein
MERIPQLFWVRRHLTVQETTPHRKVARIFLLGQISASLAAMNRTVDDYDSMAKREIIKAKQEKAQMFEFGLSYLSVLTVYSGVYKNSERTIRSFVVSLNNSKPRLP